MESLGQSKTVQSQVYHNPTVERIGELNWNKDADSDESEINNDVTN